MSYNLRQLKNSNELLPIYYNQKNNSFISWLDNSNKIRFCLHSANPKLKMFRLENQKGYTLLEWNNTYKVDRMDRIGKTIYIDLIKK